MPAKIDASLPYGLLPVEYLRAKLNPVQWGVLMQHALAFACLDGNAFGSIENDDNGFISQYAPEAYANLWSNSAHDMVGVSLPLLYPSTASDASIASRLPTHPQYDEMDDATRQALLVHFKVNPLGDPRFVETILDKAEDVLGSREAAVEWIDQFSGTLEDYPRRLAGTTEGTNKVLSHLSGISMMHHDA